MMEKLGMLSFFDEFTSEKYIKELCSENEKDRTASQQVISIIKHESRKLFLQVPKMHTLI